MKTPLLSLWLCLCLSCSTHLWAQNETLRKDLVAINKAYDRPQGLAMRVEQSLSGVGGFSGKTTIEIKAQGVKLYRKIGDRMEETQTEKYDVQVDHKRKTIMLKPAPIKSNINGWLAYLDTISRTAYDKIEVTTAKPGEKTYRLISKSGGEISFTFNEKTNFLLKLAAKGTSKTGSQNVETVFVFIYSDLTASDKKMLTLERYLVESKGQFSLQAAYQNYRLINMLAK